MEKSLDTKLKELNNQNSNQTPIALKAISCTSLVKLGNMVKMDYIIQKAINITHNLKKIEIIRILWNSSEHLS